MQTAKQLAWWLSLAVLLLCPWWPLGIPGLILCRRAD
jgi:hypothetical protein